MSEAEAVRLGRRNGGIEPAIPKLVEAQGQGGGDHGDQERFLGAVHEAYPRAGQQGPADLSAAPVTPAGRKRQQGEEDQQDFVNVIPAVENHRGRDCREQASP